LPTLLPGVLSGLALDTIAVSFYLSGLDIDLEAEEIRFTGEVGQTVFGLLASSSLVNG